MPNFLLAYHGGEALPETQDAVDALMASWQSWFEALGADVVDGGNPVGQSCTLHSDGNIEPHGGSNPISGYSIISAKDLADAQQKAAGCPVLQEEGGTIELAPIVEM